MICGHKYQKTRRHPIDRGWAWVILATAFINSILCSIVFVSGLFNVMFADMYHKSSKVTALLSTMQLTLINFLSPVGGLLIARYGPRVTVLLGAACVYLGLSLTYFAQTYTQVFITFGLVTGIGLGLVSAPSHVPIGFYFHKYRSTAYGIASSGFGIGAIALPYLLEYLLFCYGLHGSILILGGICSHLFICGALCRPYSNISMKDYDNKDNKCDKKDNHGDNRENLLCEVCKRQRTDCLCEFATYYNTIAAVDNNNSLPMRYDVVIRNNNNNNNTILSNNDVSSECVRLITKEIESADKQQNHPSIKQSLLILINLRYFLFLINSFLAGGSMACMYVHFPSFVMTKGTSINNIPVLLATMGVANIIGRLVPGILSHNSVKRLYIVYITFGISAGITSLSGLLICDTYIGQLVFAILFGFFCIAFGVLLSPLVIDIMGLEVLNMSYTIACLFYGLGNLVLPTLAGLIYDTTGIYSYIFIMTGICQIMASLAILTVFLIQYKKSGLVLSNRNY